MTTFQIVLVVLASLLVVSTVWERIAPMLNNLVDRKRKPDWMDDVANDVIKSKTELMMIVACWENLRDRCEDAGLDAAVDELTMIWPLLVDGGEDNVEIS